MPYANPEDRKANSRRYYEANKDLILEANAVREKVHPRLHYHARYRKENKTSAREYMREYERSRKSTDLDFKLRCVLRGRMSKAVRFGKAGSAIKDLGCTVSELRAHLESLFQQGMSWENYGEWHIDHMVALATVNLLDPVQFRKVAHYTNLQPLWKGDNVKKGTKLGAAAK